MKKLSILELALRNILYCALFNPQLKGFFRYSKMRDLIPDTAHISHKTYSRAVKILVENRVMRSLSNKKYKMIEEHEMYVKTNTKSDFSSNFDKYIRIPILKPWRLEDQ